MIDLIKRLVGAGAAPGGPGSPSAGHRPPERDVHLATCAVFLEMAHIDNEFDERERGHILDVFEREYGLSSEEVIELEKASGDELAKSMDLWKFTNVINEHYSNEEKFRVVELLWQLVCADGKMDEHENYFMHKLAKLLRLTHRDLINAKLKVLHPESESDSG
jgi:uncharacterized tellurite resistance protein B-like protein